MKSSTRDNAEGKLHKVKGTIKEVTGIIVGNEELENEGKDEHTKGEIQEKLGEIKKVMDK